MRKLFKLLVRSAPREKWLLPFMSLAVILALTPMVALARRGPPNAAYLNSASHNDYWILPAKSYSGNRYVTATQITPGNVGQLQPAWVFHLKDASGPLETAPIVWHGIMYVTSAHDHVYALNAKTGRLIWEFKDSPHVISFAANRGVALMDGKVFIATTDGHLIALNARTGHKVWDVVGVHNTANSFYSMAPVPYRNSKTGRDMLLLGVSNGDWGGIGNVSAFNPANGHRIWELKMVPGPGQFGHDTWSGDSWKRGGVSVWSGLAIDPTTNTLYVDTGNPQPDFLGTYRKGINLYSDSTVAVDISGNKPRIKWFHQYIAHDTHDWDTAMPPVLFHATLGGKERELVAAGDKAGNFWLLNARTGKLLDHTVVTFQKGTDTTPTPRGTVACPAFLGGIEFNGGAYDPQTNTFFVPSTSGECGFWTNKTKAVYVAGQFYAGGPFPKMIGMHYGWLNAINVSTGVFKWRHHFDHPALGGALVTASGLVFTGTVAGNFYAFDAGDGGVLWKFATGSPIIAPPMAYMANGVEYVTVASGPPGNFTPGAPESNAGPMISVFVLGK